MRSVNGDKKQCSVSGTVDRRQLAGEENCCWNRLKPPTTTSSSLRKGKKERNECSGDIVCCLSACEYVTTVPKIINIIVTIEISTLKRDVENRSRETNDIKFRPLYRR